MRIRDNCHSFGICVRRIKKRNRPDQFLFRIFVYKFKKRIQLSSLNILVMVYLRTKFCGNKKLQFHLQK